MSAKNEETTRRRANPSRAKQKIKKKSSAHFVGHATFGDERGHNVSNNKGLGHEPSETAKGQLVFTSATNITRLTPVIEKLFSTIAMELLSKLGR